MNKDDITQGEKPNKRSKVAEGGWIVRHKAKLKLLGLTDSPILQRMREKQRGYSIKRSKPNAHARIKFIDDVKMSRGCADCGYAKHPAALDFDHLPGFTKAAAISALRHRYSASIATIEAEIAKCEVVCANCHRIRTAARKHWLSNPKCTAAGQARRTPPLTQEAMDAWLAKASSFNMKRCSKCSEAGHNIRCCPQGADNPRNIICKALMVEAKTLDQLVDHTGLKRSRANWNLCDMAKKGIVRKLSRKINGRWELIRRSDADCHVTTESAK